MTMRAHILDPQLDFTSGHFPIYDAAVAAELRRRGIETLLYGSARPNASAASGLDAVPVFSHGIFEEVATDPLTWPLENFVRLGREFHADLAKLGPERFDHGDLAFFPNIIEYQIGGVRDWIMGLPPEHVDLQRHGRTGEAVREHLRRSRPSGAVAPRHRSAGR